VRADEHEGPLADPKVKKAHDRAERRSREIVGDNLLALTENKAFLFWFSRWFMPMIDTVVPVDGGAKLVAFAAKRELLITMKEELESASPGALSRLVEIRATYENELRAFAQEEE